MDISILGAPSIFAAVYIVMYMLKSAFKTNETFIKLIPLLSGVLGGVLGIISYYGFFEFVVSTSILQAFIIGSLTGLATTGSTDLINNLKSLKTKVEDFKNDIAELTTLDTPDQELVDYTNQDNKTLTMEEVIMIENKEMIQTTVTKNIE